METSKQKKNIVLLSVHIGYGGLERMIFSLCRGLKKSGEFEPHVFVYDHMEEVHEGGMVREFRQAGIPLVHYRKAAGFSWKTVFRLVRYCSENNASIIHSHNLGSLIYALAAKLLSGGRLKVIQTQHSFVHLGEKKRYWWYEWFFNRFADRVTAVSEDTRKTFRSMGFDTNEIKLIENGVEFAGVPVFREPERLRIRDRLINEVREEGAAEKLSRNRDKFWILYMARIRAEKGQPHALQLWSHLSPEERRQMALVFVGPEGQLGQIEKFKGVLKEAVDNERVIYAGLSRDPQSWLSASNLFLFCSEYEGLPLGALEALGTGLPCVLSDIEAHKSFSDMAMLVGSPEIGARAVSSYYREIISMGEEAYRRCWSQSRRLLSRYSVATMVKNYARLYDELLSGRSAAMEEGKEELSDYSFREAPYK